MHLPSCAGDSFTMRVSATCINMGCADVCLYVWFA